MLNFIKKPSLALTSLLAFATIPSPVVASMDCVDILKLDTIYAVSKTRYKKGDSPSFRLQIAFKINARHINSKTSGTITGTLKNYQFSGHIDRLSSQVVIVVNNEDLDQYKIDCGEEGDDPDISEASAPLMLANGDGLVVEFFVSGSLLHLRNKLSQIEAQQ
jgi:hypothetical protein